MPATRSRSPATCRTRTRTPARRRRGSPWLCSSPAWARHPVRRPTMGEVGRLGELLAGAFVEADVFGLRPDYRAMLIAVDGIVPSPSDDASDALLRAAEAAAREALDAAAVEQIPHLAEWREAYRAFGAKPQRTRNSVEALLRRSASGLPRVN